MIITGTDSSQLVAPEPDDDTPHETSSASSVATEPRLCGEKEDDGLKLCCRLNCNGELETIPGACRDGAGALQGGRLHFLVAVQLGLQEWGVRLLAQKDDGTLGCAAHLKWEMTADGKLISGFQQAELEAFLDRHAKPALTKAASEARH